MGNVRILRAGEQGLVVEFGNEISPAINRRVRQIGKLLSEADVKGVMEIIATYRSLMVYFDPLEISRQALIERIQEFLSAGQVDDKPQQEARVIEIPVCYGGEFGPDLDFVARHNGLSASEVVDIHSSVTYLIYMLGFTPCHPYLGGMSKSIAAPRLEKPRTVVPVGSVGIGGIQTVLYPIESPGGFRLIGRTPVRPFNPTAANPFLFVAGDYLQFRSITLQEYTAIETEINAGTYLPLIEQISVEDGGVL